MLKTKPLPLTANSVGVTATPLWRGLLLALTATLFFSLATPLSRHAILLGMNPTTMLVGRLWLSCALLGITVFFGNRADARFDRQGNRALLVIGLASAVNILAYYWALTRLESSMAIMLFAINPVAVLGLLALRGERLAPLDLLRLGLALGGVYLLIGPGGQVDPMGVLLILCSVAGFAFQMAMTQWYLRPYNAAAVTFYLVLVSAVGVTLWWGINGADMTIPGWQGWVIMVILAVVSTFLARLCFFSAIRLVGSGQMSLLMSLETLLSVTWSVWFLGEQLVPLQSMGGVLILISVFLAAWVGQRGRV